MPLIGGMRPARRARSTAGTVERKHGRGATHDGQRAAARWWALRVSTRTTTRALGSSRNLRATRRSNAWTSRRCDSASTKPGSVAAVDHRVPRPRVAIHRAGQPRAGAAAGAPRTRREPGRAEPNCAASRTGTPAGNNRTDGARPSDRAARHSGAEAGRRRSAARSIRLSGDARDSRGSARHGRLAYTGSEPRLSKLRRHGRDQPARVEPAKSPSALNTCRHVDSMSDSGSSLAARSVQGCLCTPRLSPLHRRAMPVAPSRPSLLHRSARRCHRGAPDEAVGSSRGTG